MNELERYVFTKEKARQCQDALDAMIRDGTTKVPALDQVSGTNGTKTQYTITKGQLAAYLKEAKGIETASPELFIKPEVVEEVLDVSRIR